MDLDLYTFAKSVHLISVILFIGTVYFRTFVIVELKKHFGASMYKKIDMLSGKKARDIIKVNNIFLILSGFYLLSYHTADISFVLLFKVVLGSMLAFSFYIVPLIIKRMKDIAWFSTFFHYLFFSLMMLTVLSAKHI